MVRSTCTATSEERRDFCISKSTVSASNAINHGQVTVDTAALYHHPDALFQCEQPPPHRPDRHCSSECLCGNIKAITFQ